MNICIVSPHLDDAILSCGILMQRHKAAGDEVLSLNIFTAGANAENRHLEELRAEEEIGAQAFFLDELDAPDRSPLYKSDIKLFFGAFEDVSEQYIAKVEKRVCDFFAAHKIDIAYFPLAAGTHIDHRIAHAIGRHVKDIPVKFYEDRPYILWPGVLQGRMNQLGSDAVLPHITEQMMLDALHSYHYLKYFVPEGKYQRECLPLYFAMLNQKSVCSLKLKSETLFATEAEIKKLYDSLCRYESQMKYIYPDYATFMKDSLNYERVNSGQNIYAERFWTFA
jgi:LmbE family N-acetylglucosaminyl deacetylase